MENTEKNFIQLKKDNILRIGIKDSEGNDTGEHLEFDLEDLTYPLRINKCDAMHKKNLSVLKAKLTAINNSEDKKGKYILSMNQEKEIKAYQEFYEKEMQALDLFLGEGATKKILNGRKPYFTMYEDIGEIIEPILPLIQVNTESIINKIKSSYKESENEESVLQ